MVAGKRRLSNLPAQFSRFENDRLLIILNFTANTPRFILPARIGSPDRDLFVSNYPVDPARDVRALTLRPFKARVYRFRP